MARTPYRAIPTPGNDLAQLRATVEALQENVEMMQGLRGPRGGLNQVFVQQAGPPPDGVREGDLLVNKSSGSWVIKVWSNGQWV